MISRAIKGQIVRDLFPGIDKCKIKRLLDLAEEKNVDFIDIGLMFNLRGIYASMIRHDETNYDMHVVTMGKSEAREHIRPTIERKLADIGKNRRKGRRRYGD